MFLRSDSRRLPEDIAYIKPETIFHVPAQMEVFRKMVQAHGAEAARAILGDNLRFIYTGGASLKTDVADSMEQLGITILSGYGMTEVMIAASANDLVNRRGVAGYPAPSVELCIDRSDANGSGEILIRGNTLFSGLSATSTRSNNSLTPWEKFAIAIHKAVKRAASGFPDNRFL